MARGQTGTGTSTAAKKNGSTRRRRKSSPARAQAAMTRAVDDDVAAMRAEVRDMIASLEDKIERLNTLTKRGATHAAEGANDIVMSAISGLTGQMTGRMEASAKSASDEVAKFGNQAIRRIVAEIDQRPFLTLAIAAGIGFIAGLARRSE